MIKYSRMQKEILPLILKFCEVNNTLEMAELEFSQELDWRDYHSLHEYSDDNEGTQNGRHTLDGKTQVGHFVLYSLFKGARLVF